MSNLSRFCQYQMWTWLMMPFFLLGFEKEKKKAATKLKFTHKIQLTTVSIWFMYVFPGKAAFWVAPINSVLVLWTCCSLDKGDVTINHCESRWNSEHWIQTASPWCYIYTYIYIEKCQNLLIGIWQPMIGIFPSMIGIWQPLIGIWQPLIGIWHVPLKSWNWHPSIQALSTSSRSWLGLEFSAAWTSEMRNNYGCSRTLNTVWYGVVTCGMLILASARGSKNDNRKRYAFGPCCFLQVVARICWMPAQVIFLQVSFDVAYIRDRQKNELWAMLLLHHQKLKKTLPVLSLISKMLTGIRRCLNNQICAKRVVSIQQRLIICFRPCSSWTLVQTLCG